MDQRDPLTQEVIGAAIEVHREMGTGLLESVYQACMEEELRLRGLAFAPQSRIPLVYKGKSLDLDLVMDLHFPEKLAAACCWAGSGMAAAIRAARVAGATPCSNWSRLAGPWPSQ
jgi:hypothetical protein